jgi:hypothetical protein
MHLKYMLPTNLLFNRDQNYALPWIFFWLKTRKNIVGRIEAGGHKDMSSILADQYEPIFGGGRGVAGSQPTSTLEI